MEFRGVFAIPCTPFTASGEVDWESLRREVRFCLDCGAHGLVAPVNASEFTSLSDDERQRVVEVVAGENAGQVPFVAGVSGVSAPVAIGFARHAHDVGADALIAMPPYVKKYAGQEIYDYYAQIAAAVDLPIVLQDWVPPIGTPMGAELLARMLREIPNVCYLKEETAVATHVMTAVATLAVASLEGMMGGQGGRFLFDEVARGSRGTMPACHTADIQVAVWSRIEAGDLPAARELFNQLLPLLNMETVFGVAVYKEVLRRRGVIATNVCRGAFAPLDAYDLRELDILLAAIEPLYRVRY